MLPVYVCVSVCVWKGGDGGMTEILHTRVIFYLPTVALIISANSIIVYSTGFPCKAKGGILSTEKACWQVICKNNPIFWGFQE